MKSIITLSMGFEMETALVCNRKGLPQELVRAILLWINKKQLPVEIFVAIPRRLFKSESCWSDHAAKCGVKVGADIITWFIDCAQYPNEGGYQSWGDLVRNHSYELKTLEFMKKVGRGA